VLGGLGALADHENLAKMRVVHLRSASALPVAELADSCLALSAGHLNEPMRVALEMVLVWLWIVVGLGWERDGKLVRNHGCRLPVVLVTILEV